MRQFSRQKILLPVMLVLPALLVCTTDLNAIQNTPEGNQFRTALLRYAKSAQFQPDTVLSWEELTGLFTGTVTQRDIQGVKNQSDYNTNVPM